MRVALKVNLEIPQDFEYEELAQVIFDGFINYAIVAHLMDSMKWIPKDKILATYHETWADIIRNAEWTLESN